jgi:hypothetical protein
MASRSWWWRIALPLAWGVALGVALSFFLSSLPWWLGTVFLVAGASALSWWATKQLLWARRTLRELKDLDDD